MPMPTDTIHRPTNCFGSTLKRRWLSIRVYCSATCTQYQKLYFIFVPLVSCIYNLSCKWIYIFILLFNLIWNALQFFISLSLLAARVGLLAVKSYLFIKLNIWRKIRKKWFSELNDYVRSGAWHSVCDVSRRRFRSVYGRCDWRVKKKNVCVRLDVYVAAAEVRYGFVHSTIVSFWGDWECVPTRADLWVAWQLMDSGIIGICLIWFFIAFH